MSHKSNGTPHGFAELSALSAQHRGLRHHPHVCADATAAFHTLPHAFGKPGEAASEAPGRAVVSDFLNKVLKLAALRIADICERLSFEPVDKIAITVQASGDPTHGCMQLWRYLLTISVLPLCLGFSGTMPLTRPHHCSSILEGPGMLEGFSARACRKAHWCRASSEAEQHQGRAPPGPAQCGRAVLPVPSRAKAIARQSDDTHARHRCTRWWRM